MKGSLLRNGAAKMDRMFPAEERRDRKVLLNKLVDMKAQHGLFRWV